MPVSSALFQVPRCLSGAIFASLDSRTRALSGLLLARGPQFSWAWVDHSFGVLAHCLQRLSPKPSLKKTWGYRCPDQGTSMHTPLGEVPGLQTPSSRCSKGSRSSRLKGSFGLLHLKEETTPLEPRHFDSVHSLRPRGLGCGELVAIDVLHPTRRRKTRQRSRGPD